MFEFLFKYPGAVFRKGAVCAAGLLAAVDPGGWASLAAGGLLLWHVRRNRGSLTGARPLVIWMLETAMIALLLFLLWHPAISIATLRPQQNVVAVMVDDSRSMAIQEGSADAQRAGRRRARRQTASRAGAEVSSAPVSLRQGSRSAFRKPANLRPRSRPRAWAIACSRCSRNRPLCRWAPWCCFPMARIIPAASIWTPSRRSRQRRIPVHTIGFGREKAEKDVEITDAVLPSHALADSRLSALVTFRQYGYARPESAGLGTRCGQGSGFARGAVEIRRCPAKRNAAVQRRPGRSQDAGDLHRSAARRGEPRQQLVARGW